MQTYIATGVHGSVAKSQDGSSTTFFGMPGGFELKVEAGSRVDAFILAHRHCSAKGLDVAVRTFGSHKGGITDQPLGFSAEERAHIKQAGIVLKTPFPDRDGVQIERLYLEEAEP